MKQNLMYEPKIYKDPEVQKWADKVLKLKRKKNASLTLEDMVVISKTYQGLTYEQIMKQSLYQLYADFYRICQFEQFYQSTLFATVSSDVKIEHFAKNIDIYTEGDPYKDLFVSSDKLKGLNEFFN